MIYINFLFFWKDFDMNKNEITDFLKNNNIDYIISYDLESLDLLFIGSFLITEDDYYSAKGLPINVKKILFVSEPIEYFYGYTFKLVKENFFNYIFGCVSNEFNENNKQIYFKVPFYCFHFFFRDKNIYSLTNNYVKNMKISSLIKKKIYLFN